jgi:phosphoglycerate dehydrogenase-like enzyme
VVIMSVPWPDWIDELAPVPAGVEYVEWDLTGVAPRTDIEVVVPTYLGDRATLARLAELPDLRLVQTLTAGYEDVLPYLPPGVALANAAGVHDASTAELAVGLAIAALRGFPAHLRSQFAGEWRPDFGTSLADRKVLLVGFGGVGQAVARRLAGFEVEVTAVASRAREVDPGVSGGSAIAAVHGVDELAELVPQHDVVILTVPLTAATAGLVDADFLAAMPAGALLVNVARGGVVVTDALVAELASGRLRAALDVVDPEPLPPDHPLWSQDGLLLTPHVGGASSAFRPRALAMLRDLADRLSAGRPPERIVVAGERPVA